MNGKKHKEEMKHFCVARSSDKRINFFKKNTIRQFRTRKWHTKRLPSFGVCKGNVNSAGEFLKWLFSAQ